MPGMSGPDLAVSLKRVRSSMSVLYMSGYTDHAQVLVGIEEGCIEFLQKPFMPAALLAHVDRLIAARKA
jgi:two-component system, cell cycle sensor histidine kinase and response regulator CckA